MDLTKRQQVILKAVVEEFTRTVQPIGSKSLIPLLPVSISSATIRNELALLEKEGLLEKTHTSSGRIPSAKGYRYYVEHLMHIELDDSLEQRLRQMFAAPCQSFDDIVCATGSILADLTHLTSLIVEPAQSQQRLVRLSLIPVGPTQAVALAVASTGQTEHRMFSFSSPMSHERLAQYSELINEGLTGIAIDQSLQQLKWLFDAKKSLSGSPAEIFEAFRSALTGFEDQPSRVFGRANMLEQPEFSDLTKLETVMRVLDSQALFQKWTEKPESISTQISSRNELIQIGDLSVVVTKFDTGLGEKGQLMVVGPSRMPYAKVIALMDFLSEQIENMFGPRLEGEQDEQESTQKTS